MNIINIKQYICHIKLIVNEMTFRGGSRMVAKFLQESTSIAFTLYGKYCSLIQILLPF